MRILRHKLALIAVAAVVVALAVITIATMGLASAADEPLTIKLTKWMDGNNVAVDVSITNNGSENLSLDINALLPAGAKLVAANPQGSYKVIGGVVNWQANISPGKTVVGYQYKLQVAQGTTSVVVNYIGKTRGAVTSAALDVAAPAGLAQLSVVATAAPKAQVEIVPIVADATVTNAITATIPGTTIVAAASTSGLPNVSVGVPVVLSGSSTDPNGPIKTYAWTLSKPSTSKSALDKTNAPVVKFTPDVVGVYKVDLVASNEVGASPMASIQVHADTYIGVEQGGCAKCHSGKVTEWLETGHATKLKREIDGSADPANSKYSEGCVRCHVVGYNIGAQNGGFAELQAKTGWKFPSVQSIKSGTAGNWNAVPAALKNVANIQCENCHGPANEHATKGSATMAASLDAGVCNACHDGGGSHLRGSELANSNHSKAEATPWTYPTGASRQGCVRCHSGKGFISFVKNPKEQASWNNEPQTLTCAVCHEPHSDANPLQLRVEGQPIEANGVTKDFGLSATCATCHNARTPASEAVKGSTPHYSAAAEMLSNSGGVEYGQQVANSPHSTIVGATPVKNPSDPTGKAMLFGGEAPGPCVVCHMWPKPSDAKDPNRNAVGQHSFNALSPDGKVQYTASCAQCHGTLPGFNFGAKADYDGNGKVEGVQTEVAGMLKVLKQGIADSGIKPLDARPYFDQTNKAKWTDSQYNAIYNYLFVKGRSGLDGRSSAIHNFKRSIHLLQLSYKDLTGKDVPNASLVK